MSPLQAAWRRALLRTASAGPGAWAASVGLGGLLGARTAQAQTGDAVRRGRVLAFPRDHGAHLGTRIEWWYATGWLGSEAAPQTGFQVTFFRSRTGLAEHNRSRFAARHLLFAHAALTRLDAAGEGTHLHDQRIARWSGAPDSVLGRAAVHDGDVRLGCWSLQHDVQQWRASVPARGFTLTLRLVRSQPTLLQGDNGYSRKGPDEAQASHYYSDVQLQANGSDGSRGRAWLDHEWSDQLLPSQAVGWDWIGINLFDGSALTAFTLRRGDGSALWAGGSFRPAGGAAQPFGADAVRMTPGRRWQSPGSGARYPVQWQVDTPAGRFEVRALMDAQELDSRRSTGTVYWEGLSELLDAQGRRVGLGYLELTGYAAPLQLN